MSSNDMIVEADEALKKAVVHSTDQQLDSSTNIVQSLDDTLFNKLIAGHTLYYPLTYRHIHCPTLRHLDLQFPTVGHY